MALKLLVAVGTGSFSFFDYLLALSILFILHSTALPLACFRTINIVLYALCWIQIRLLLLILLDGIARAYIYLGTFGGLYM